MLQNQVRQVLARTEKDLERYQTRGPQFQVSNAAETIARCHRLLGDESSAHRYFTTAAWAARKALDARLAQGISVERNSQWGYLFKSLWMYYQAGSPHRAEDALQPLIGLLDEWPAPVSLLQRVQGTLACYVAGDIDQAQGMYGRFELSRWEATPHHPEVKLLKAGLFGDQEAAGRAVEIAERMIAEDEIRPWDPNHLEYDLLSMAKALLGRAG